MEIRFQVIDAWAGRAAGKLIPAARFCDQPLVNRLNTVRREASIAAEFSTKSRYKYGVRLKAKRNDFDRTHGGDRLPWGWRHCASNLR
jgi:hypothetical protein